MKRQNLDLDGFRDNFESIHHLFNLVMAFSKVDLISGVDMAFVMILTSSAYCNTRQSFGMESDKSFTKSVNRRGLRTPPCGIPVKIWHDFDADEPMVTLNFLSVREFCIYCIIG